MILPSFAKNRVYAVYGLGISGIASASALLQAGATVYAWDDNEAAREKLLTILAAKKVPTQALQLKAIDAWDYSAIEALVLSPGVPLTHPEPLPEVVKRSQSANITITSDIDLLFQSHPKSHYVSITGTNGKSTTTSLLGFVLKQLGHPTELGGNLGMPALELTPLGADGYYVLELSSYQLDLLHHYKSQISILLNITPDHLSRHGGLEGYIAAKKHIFDRQDQQDTAILSIDNPHTKRLFERLAMEKRIGNVMAISTEQEVSNGVSIIDQQCIVAKNGSYEAFPLPIFKYLPGKHNQENIAACIAACVSLGAPVEQVIKAISQFKGLKHRIEIAAEQGPFLFINDSKATNAEAAEKALLSFDPALYNIYWIAGGVAKEGGIEMLEPLFSRMTHAFLIGEAAGLFAGTLAKHVAHSDVTTLNNAIDAAYAMAQQDMAKQPKRKAVILLSPACASFDQYRNFEERGEAFCNYVQSLLKQEKASA